MRPHAIDLLHMDVPGAIAASAVEGPQGWVLIESGPSCTGETLDQGLRDLGVEPEELAAFRSDSDPAKRTDADIVTAIKTCYDPEIPVDIYELGLIYVIEVREANAVFVQMTLTSPMCPVAETLPPEVEDKVRSVPGVAGVELELVWDPPWSPDLMTEAARLQLNM